MFVALIAVFHVVASHITVGAAWFNVYIERKAVRENRPELYQYLERSARGLLVFAYVFGAMAGVGIWQSTTAANPRGISTLIHNFVFFWGSEWYMFLIDVIGIIVYYYTLHKVDAKSHLRMAWILAYGGTGTLALIVGILGFKLTPGDWLTTGEPLDGFYNPTFWPQFVMRLLFMLALTSLWAIANASMMPKDFPERQNIIRWAGRFGLGGVITATLIGVFWYFPAIPEANRALLDTVAYPAVTTTAIVAGLIAVAIGLGMAALVPRLHTRIGSLALFFMAFTAIFAAERTRELLRKPDVINGYMAANQLIYDPLEARGIESEEALVNAEGAQSGLPFLAAVAAQSELASADGEALVTSDGELAAGAQQAQDDAATVDAKYQLGHMLAVQECSACHSVSDQTVIKLGDTQLALRQQSRLLVTRGLTEAETIATFLEGLDGYLYMHAFVGTDEEREALAYYLASVVESQQGEQ
jgi:mono/diheme cytochrome c family protein